MAHRPRGGAAPPREALAGPRLHAHAQPARAVVLELHHAVGEGEEGVVLGQADILARLPLGAVLAQDDRAPADGLPAEALHPEALGVTVAPVAARPLPLLVCHGSQEPLEKTWSGSGLAG